MHLIRGLLILSSVSLLSLSPLVMADDIYRTVDAQGNVTYSDQPPSSGQEAERVELPPGPSPERIRESEARNRAISNAAEKAENKRIRQEHRQDQKIEDARKALQAAKAKLTAAKEIKDDDRQNLAGGKRRIRPEYFDRLKAAEAEVEKARKQLQEAQGY
jgi:hypothetical protein